MTMGYPDQGFQQTVGDKSMYVFTYTHTHTDLGARHSVVYLVSLSVKNVVVDITCRGWVRIGTALVAAERGRRMLVGMDIQ